MSSKRKLVILIMTIVSILIGCFAALAYTNHDLSIQDREELWEEGVNTEYSEFNINRKIIEVSDSEYYDFSFISGLGYTDNASYIRSTERQTSVDIIKGITEDRIISKVDLEKGIELDKYRMLYNERTAPIKSVVKYIGNNSWITVLTKDTDIYDKTIKLFKSEPKKYEYSEFNYNKVAGAEIPKVKSDNAIDIKVGELKFRSEQTNDGYISFGYRIMLYDEAVNYVNSRGQILTGKKFPDKVKIIGDLRYYRYGNYHYLVNKVDMNNQFIIEGYGKYAEGSIFNYILSLGI